MSPTELALIGACLLLGAALYTSVGHAGASAYIAILGAFGFSAATIKPTAPTPRPSRTVARPTT